MGRIRRSVAVAVALGLAMATAGATPVSAQERAPAAPSLVTGDDRPTAGRGTILRQREVTLDLRALRSTGRSTVRLEIFDDVDVMADLVPSPSGAEGWTAWSGVLAGRPDSSVTVASDGVTASALVTEPGGTYRVRPGADGDLVAQQVRPLGTEGDDAVAPPATTPDAPVAPPDAPGPPSVPAASTEPATAGDLPAYPVVDVLVGYTPAALTQAGSLDLLEDEAAMAIAVSNAAFSTSGITGQFRLAGVQSIPEDATCDQLSLIRAKGDGYADGLHTRREQLGADIVTVLSGAGCGRGYRPLSASQLANSENMFSVVGYTWAVDNLTFPHELGHNMGMNHDRYEVETYETNPGDLYPYGYGYVNVAGGWRTIMAYNVECSDAGGSCQRLTRFSNPDLTYNGAATGRPSSGSRPADARLVLDQTFRVVADLRSTPDPFTTWTRFVQQQARDFQFGAAVPSSTAASLSSQLTLGQLDPAAHVETLMRGSFASAHAPVTRLYSAYFLRLPDLGGLDYWVGEYRRGLSISVMSARFAGSSEFRTRYGSLSNRAFVERIYENVLGRPGEPAGVTYWAGVLDRREKNRGQVMVGFSESAENKSVLARPVDVVMLYRGLLARMPTTAESNAAVARLAAGTTVRRLVQEIMATTPYSTRVVT